jgi:hypothetical protein
MAILRFAPEKNSNPNPLLVYDACPAYVYPHTILLATPVASELQLTHQNTIALECHGTTEGHDVKGCFQPTASKRNP